jgi:SET domain-containing protein
LRAKKRYRATGKIEVRHSPGKGRGVFAVKALRRGEVIETAPVLIVPRRDEEALAASFLRHYMFQTDNGRHYAVALGFASMINHDDDANAEFFVDTGTIVIRALRRIRAGDEVTVNYGWHPEEWADAGVT